MKSSIRAILLMVVFLAGCGTKTVYNPKDIKIVSEGVTETGLKLTFRPMAESMYYCPGVIYEQKGSQIYFKYVRCNIKQKDADIHLRAVPEKNGNLSVTFPFPKNQKRIELVNSLGERFGAWERGKDNNYVHSSVSTDKAIIKTANQLISAKGLNWGDPIKVQWQAKYSRHVVMYPTPKEEKGKVGSRGVFVFTNGTAALMPQL